MTKLKWIALALLVLLPAGGAAGYYVYTTRPGYLLARGRTAVARGDLDEAWRYARALERRGLEDHARLLRGEAWLAEGRAPSPSAAGALRHALQELGGVRDDGPLATEGAVLAGECLVRLEQQRVAADVLGAVVRRQPDCREAHRWLAAVYIDLNTWKEAIHHLQEWGRLAPDDGRPYRWMGMFYKDYTQQQGLAIEAYREALRRALAPDAQNAVRRELAMTLLEGEANFQGVLDVLDGCPEALRKTPEIRTLRAEALWGLGRRDVAAAVADEVLRTAPDYPRALGLRGRMYLAEDEPRRARPLFERAVALEPYDLGSRQHLIEVCDQLNDRVAVEEQRRLLEEARDYHRRVSALYRSAEERPWDAQVRYEIALLCLKANHKEQAQTMLRAALACDPGHPEARRLLEQQLGGRGG
jgi:tetratricopeptide (TPR) repeat protein